MGNSILEVKKEIGEQFEKNEDIFFILGDATRVKIIITLLERGNKEMSVEEITSAVYLSRPAVSHHIKTLKEVGILKMRQKANFNYYSLNRSTPIWAELCSLFSKVDSLLQLYKEEENGKISKND